MNSSVTVIFAIAFVAGVVGSEIGYRQKRLKRSISFRLAVHLCSGFLGALLVLILLSRADSYQLVIAITVGISYGYYMVDAKAYNEIR